MTGDCFVKHMEVGSSLFLIITNIGLLWVIFFELQIILVKGYFNILFALCFVFLFIFYVFSPDGRISYMVYAK